MTEPTKRTTQPAAFPMPPKSTLFSRLEAFLPVLATENEKLEAAIANGEGDRHNIEIPEPDAVAAKDNGDSEASEEDDDSDVDMDDTAASNKTKKAPVIEMNFALGLMEEGGSDADSSADDDDDEKDEIDLAASIAAARLQPSMSAEHGDGSSTLQLPATKAATKPPTRPLIQELN